MVIGALNASTRSCPPVIMVSITHPFPIISFPANYPFQHGLENSKPPKTPTATSLPCSLAARSAPAAFTTLVGMSDGEALRRLLLTGGGCHPPPSRSPQLSCHPRERCPLKPRRIGEPNNFANEVGCRRTALALPLSHKACTVIRFQELDSKIRPPFAFAAACTAVPSLILQFSSHFKHLCQTA